MSLRTARRIDGPAGGAALLGLLVVVLTLACAPGIPSLTVLEQLSPSSASGFNLLLITLDTTRADRLGAYGHPTARTPTIDTLASAGIRFDDAVTVAPLTLPAHASLLTGLYPPNHGARVNGHHRLDESHQTLAETLGAAGYQTAAFVSSFVLDARFGLSQGFDAYDARVEPTTVDAFGGSNERSAEGTTDAALGWLSNRDVDRPFFAWVHYFDPHHAYAPPPEYAVRFADRPYDGEIAYVDTQIGRLLDALQPQGGANRTIVIVAADHGESLGEHGETFHGRTLYEGAVRVPLVIAAPSLIPEAGVVDGVVVSLVDLFPTIVELLGIPRPGPMDGVSLLRTDELPGRMVYLETQLTYLDSGWAPLHAVRRHGAKLIAAPRPEYYDLFVDPGETTDLYARESDARAPLAAHLAALDERWPDLRLTSRDVSPIDEETRSRLLALGYISGVRLDRPSRLPDPKDMLPAHELMVQAEALRRAGRLEQALERVDAAVAMHPRSPDALHRQGELLAVLDRLDEAERALRRSLAIRELAPTLALLAQVLTKAGRFDEASDLLDRATEIDPDHGGVLVARGDLLVFQGRAAEAIPLYERAREIDPYRAAGLVRTRIEAVRRLEASGATPPR